MKGVYPVSEIITERLPLEGNFYASAPVKPMSAEDTVNFIENNFIKVCAGTDIPSMIMSDLSENLPGVTSAKASQISVSEKLYEINFANRYKMTRCVDELSGKDVSTFTAATPTEQLCQSFEIDRRNGVIRKANYYPGGRVISYSFALTELPSEEPEDPIYAAPVEAAVQAPSENADNLRKIRITKAHPSNVHFSDNIKFELHEANPKPGTPSAAEAAESASSAEHSGNNAEV